MRSDEETKCFLRPDIDQLVSFLIVFATNCRPPKSVRGFESNAHPLRKFRPIDVTGRNVMSSYRTEM